MTGVRVIVAGGAGFIGSHLCERLLNQGNKVLCVDNFCTGSWENVASLKRHSQFQMVHHDVTLPFHLEADAIYNLACPASPVHYQRDPVQTTRTSVVGAMNLLALAKRLDIPILQASTSEVYGDPLEHPQTEAYWGHVNPIGPRACYDEGKRCAETLFFDYWRRYRLPIKIARIFNTYGPRMQPHDGRVISNFIVAALRGAPLLLYGEGAQTRSFCYVDDLIDGLIRLMGSDVEVTGPINLGNCREITIRELAQLTASLTDCGASLELRPLPEDDPHRRCPDTRKAFDLLRWRAETPLEEGLKRTIAYFRTLL